MSLDVEKDFESITKLVLGTSLQGHAQYEKWLFEHVRPPVGQKSAVGTKVMYVPSYSYYTEPGKKAITLKEGEELGKKSISGEELEKLGIKNASSLLSKIKYYSPEVESGTNIEIKECGVYFWSSNCFRGTWIGHAKNCSYCMWPRNSEYCFGCDFAFSCKFCLKCYHSVLLVRCFEVSHSNNCSDCLFCHNCENLQEAMFCSNAKGMRYAIANREVGKEEYMKVKKLVLDEIVRKLEKNKTLEISIFNIGCAKARG